MTQVYRAMFTRYKNHRRTYMGPKFIKAGSFTGASGYAGRMVEGMQAADPDGEYELCSLECDGLRMDADSTGENHFPD